MLEAKYFRDYKHSYMILRCEKPQVEKSYQCRLLTSGRVEGILRCSLRHVNGETYYYYDISSKAAFESLYRGRQMNWQQVRDLFEQLYGIYCGLGDCFMEESRLALLPACIFYDLSRKKYIGLYYPDYEPESPYQELMDFLLEHIDNQDERLTNCVYRIYERMEESSFSLRDALEILGEDEGAAEGGTEGGTEGAKKETGKMADFQAVRMEQPFPAAEPGEESALPPRKPLEEEPYGFYDEPEEQTPSPKKRKLFYPALSLFSLLGIAGMACVYSLYELSGQEATILLACGGLMCLCLLAGLLGTIKGGVREVKVKRKAKPKRESFSEEEDVFAPPAGNLLPIDRKVVDLERVLSREMDAAPVPRRERFGSVGFQENVFQKEPQGEACGNTVFFDSARAAEHKLYAMDKKNKKHIDLQNFPYTVGKMAGCVDCVLEDDSVSRIHARFDKAGEAVQLTDMNSTNGTYKNGLRMEPQETVEIEPGDEIRFGNLHYCYR